MRWIVMFAQDVNAETDIRVGLDLLAHDRTPEDREIALTMLTRSAGKVQLLDSGSVPS